MALEKRIVYARRGRTLPSETRHKHFVGYDMVGDTEQADHVVPGGSRYRIKPKGELVSWTSYHRCAVRDGDIGETPEDAPADKSDAKASAKKAEG